MLEQQDIEQVREIMRQELEFFNRTDRFTFQKLLQILDGRNIQLGQNTGTKIGTSATQKLSVYGETPAVQGAAISDPSGGVTQDAEARTAINALIDRLQAFGIIA